MHDGCAGPSTDGKMMVNKVRMMGFAKQPMPMPLEIDCSNCDNTFSMMTFESACPECRMVYGVTPCSATDPSKVKPAGVDY